MTRAGYAMTFAVIKTGGKQYKVAANDILKIEKLDAEAGTIVTFDQVLMVGDEVGAPLIEGALVAAELLETKKQKTVIIFKKNRRHNYRRRNGHRQLLSTVRITEILVGGAQPTIKAEGIVAAPATEVAGKPAKVRAAAKAAAALEAKPAVATATEATAPVKKASPKKAAPAQDATATEDTAAAKPAKKAAAKKAAPKADQE